MDRSAVFCIRTQTDPLESEMIRSVFRERTDRLCSVSLVLHLRSQCDPEFRLFLLQIKEFDVADEFSVLLTDHRKDRGVFRKFFLYPVSFLFRSICFALTAEKTIDVLVIVDHDEILFNELLRHFNKADILRFKHLFHIVLKLSQILSS